MKRLARDPEGFGERRHLDPVGFKVGPEVHVTDVMTQAKSCVKQSVTGVTSVVRRLCRVGLQ